MACFGFQYALLRALTAVGVPRPVGNGLGFALSAQINFVLSSVFTWRDRRRDDGHGYAQSRRNNSLNGSRWASYNAVAVVALVVNVVVFTSTYEPIGALLASAVGVAAGALVTYLMCDRVVFLRQVES
jgi:putative flippase GtrA